MTEYSQLPYRSRRPRCRCALLAPQSWILPLTSLGHSWAALDERPSLCYPGPKSPSVQSFGVAVTCRREGSSTSASLMDLHWFVLHAYNQRLVSDNNDLVCKMPREPRSLKEWSSLKWLPRHSLNALVGFSSFPWTSVCNCSIVSISSRRAISLRCLLDCIEEQ